MTDSRCSKYNSQNQSQNRSRTDCNNNPSCNWSDQKCKNKKCSDLSNNEEGCKKAMESDDCIYFAKDKKCMANCNNFNNYDDNNLCKNETECELKNNKCGYKGNKRTLKNLIRPIIALVVFILILIKILSHPIEYWTQIWTNFQKKVANTKNVDNPTDIKENIFYIFIAICIFIFTINITLNSFKIWKNKNVNACGKFTKKEQCDENTEKTGKCEWTNKVSCYKSPTQNGFIVLITFLFISIIPICMLIVYLLKEQNVEIDLIIVLLLVLGGIIWGIIATFKDRIKPCGALDGIGNIDRCNSNDNDKCMMRPCRDRSKLIQEGWNLVLSCIGILLSLSLWVVKYIIPNIDADGRLIIQYILANDNNILYTLVLLLSLIIPLTILLNFHKKTLFLYIPYIIIILIIGIIIQIPLINTYILSKLTNIPKLEDILCILVPILLGIFVSSIYITLTNRIRTCYVNDLQNECYSINELKKIVKENKIPLNFNKDKKDSLSNCSFCPDINAVTTETPANYKCKPSEWCLKYGDQKYHPVNSSLGTNIIIILVIIIICLILLYILLYKIMYKRRIHIINLLTIFWESITFNDSKNIILLVLVVVLIMCLSMIVKRFNEAGENVDVNRPCGYYQNKKDCINFGVTKDDGVCKFNELSKGNKCYDPIY